MAKCLKVDPPPYAPLIDVTDPAVQLMAVEFVQLEAELYRVRDENEELKTQVIELRAALIAAGKEDWIPVKRTDDMSTTPPRPGEPRPGDKPPEPHKPGDPLPKPGHEHEHERPEKK